MKTNWEEVIKISQEQGLISSEEANDLKKLAGLGQIPNKIWRKALKGLTTFGRGLKQHAPAVLAGAIILPYATQMARAVSRPIMNIVAYNRMKEQLERIAPDIVKKYDEKQRVFADGTCDSRCGGGFHFYHRFPDTHTSKQVRPTEQGPD